MRTNGWHGAAGRFLALAGLQVWVSACALDASNVADPEIAVKEEPVIFGEDDRLDYDQFSANSVENRWARATASIMNGGITCSGPVCDLNWQFAIPPGNLELCPQQPFWLQAKASGHKCSSVLVGPRLVATAAHCIPDRDNCTNLKVVFGFQQENGNFGNTEVFSSDVYTCNRVVDMAGGEDWAVIEVDRPVSGRIPMWIRRGGDPTVGTPLTVIGYPSALPLKIDQGATVKSVFSTVLLADVDVSEGSSGGPVIETANGVVEALAVGTNDSTFVTSGTPGNQCLLWNYCDLPTGCLGFAQAVRTTRFASLVPLHPAGIVVVTSS